MTGAPRASEGARELDLALLIADLCGYTALTEAHGALEASEIVLRFETLARECLDPGAVLVNSLGDEVFCAGANAVAVVRSALRLRDRGAREAGFPRIRAGINCGSVVVRANRYFGAAINLTARLADRAAGGQILCTRPVAISAQAVSGIRSVAIGAIGFKNVALPVEVFELEPADEKRAPAAIDPVCRMQIDAARAAGSITHRGRVHYFCSAQCQRVFADTPHLYDGEAGA